MDIKSLVQWCVNRYLSLVERYKGALYERDMYFQPNLIKRDKLAKLIFLTALLNNREDEEEIYSNSEEMLSAIERTLDSLYENIKGYWDESWTICMNLWKYKEKVNYEYNCFFFQLLIVEYFVRRLKQEDEIEWLEHKLIELPIYYERGEELRKIAAKDSLKKLMELLEEYAYIFNINERGLRLETVKIYSFYERYFYLAELGKKKNQWYICSSEVYREDEGNTGNHPAAPHTYGQRVPVCIR